MQIFQWKLWIFQLSSTHKQEIEWNLSHQTYLVYFIYIYNTAIFLLEKKNISYGLKATYYFLFFFKVELVEVVRFQCWGWCWLLAAGSPPISLQFLSPSISFPENTHQKKKKITKRPTAVLEKSTKFEWNLPQKAWRSALHHNASQPWFFYHLLHNPSGG